MLKLLPALSSDIVITMETEMSFGSIVNILDPNWLEVAAPVWLNDNTGAGHQKNEVDWKRK